MSNTSASRPARAFYPLLLAALPVLRLYSANAYAADPPLPEVAGLLALVVAATALCWATASLALRNQQRGAAVTAALVAAFFCYGPLSGLLTRLVAPVAALSPRYQLLAWGLVTLATAVLVGRIRRWDATVRFLNAASAFLLLMVAASAVGAYRHVPRWQPDDVVPERLRAVSPDAPDIIYVVLDAYGSEDSLKQFYGVDIGDFTAAMRQRGFYVADQSICNYPFTALSLASSLNMQYLDVSGGLKGVTARSTQMIRNNRVAHLLRQMGYRFVSVASGCETTEVRSADRYFQPAGSMDEFDSVLLGGTPLPLLREMVVALTGGNVSQQRFHRRRIIETLDRLHETRDPDRPSFIFAHLICPHHPFVLLDGEQAMVEEHQLRTDDKFWENRDYDRRYGQQVARLNPLVEAMTDRLLAASPRPCIVVIQGDHGPWQAHWDWRDQQQVARHMPILNLIRLPDGSEGLYRELTPVNLFRLILSRSFGLDLPLLPDQSHPNVVAEERLDAR